MLLWIFQQIVISLVVIVLIHSIYRFLQNNLTTPKVRDLVNKPTKRYEEIYKTFESKIEITSTEEDLKTIRYFHEKRIAELFEGIIFKKYTSGNRGRPKKHLNLVFPRQCLLVTTLQMRIKLYKPYKESCHIYYKNETDFKRSKSYYGRFS